MKDDQFQIPKLLLDREKQKSEEYRNRADMDSKELGISEGELE